MPLPKPKENEKYEEFIQRCASDDTMNKEYPDEDQRIAVCHSLWKKIAENNVQITSLLHNMSQIIDKKTMEGVEYYVAPTIMIVEGVLNNRYYSKDEIARRPEQWNGRPVIIQHSMDALGRPKSANDPEERNKRTVGWLYNTIYEDGKLKSEAWINPEKCKHVRYGDIILQKLEDNEPIEVSTGVWTTDIQQNGKFNQKQYDAIATNLGADHLALLPFQQGACNWNDGAGLPRINQQKGNKTVKEDKSAFSKLLDSIKQNFTFKTNELTVSDMRSDLLKQLEQKYDKEDENAFLHDILPDKKNVVFELQNSENSRLFKANYDVESGRAILRDDNPVEVYLKTEYVSLNRSSNNININDKEKRTMDKNEIIGHLIENTEQYDEKDREDLGKLSDSILAKIKEDADKAVKANEKDPKQNKQSNEPENKEPVKDVEPKQEEFRFNSEEDLLNALPEGEIKEQMKEAVEIRTNHHNNLVESITKNENNSFTKEELNAKSLNELKNIANLARVSVYEGVQGGQPVSNDKKVPDMPKINWNEK